jgi:hypothetical protein
MRDLFNLLTGITVQSGRIDILDPKDNKGIGVSTIDSSDLGFETAILDGSGAHPVERYDTLEQAKAGHAKWVKKAKAGLKHIVKLGYGDLIGSKKMKLVPRKD